MNKLSFIDRLKSFYLSKHEQMVQAAISDFLKEEEPSRKQAKLEYRGDIYVLSGWLGLGPHLFIGAVLPVYFGCRKASCMFEDELDNPEFESILAFSRELKARYDINLAFVSMKAENRLLGMYFFFKGDEGYKKVNEIQERIDSITAESTTLKDIFDDAVIIRLFGELLGYPECCIKWSLDVRSKNDSIEIRSRDALRLIGEIDGDYITFKDNPSSYSYFAYEFYPCNPHCPKAEKIGKDIKKRLEKESPLLGRAFDIYISYNVRRILLPGLDGIDRGELERECGKRIWSLLRVSDYAGPQGNQAKNLPKKVELKQKMIESEILPTLDIGMKYTEQEINEILSYLGFETATTRRDMIGLGYLERKIDGSEYWVKQKGVK